MNQRIGRTSDAIRYHDNEMAGLAHALGYRRADAATRGADRGRLWPMAGRIAAQAFYIAVVLFVFANLQDRNETITIALIGVVFASLRASTLAGACAQRRIALLLENEIKNVRQALAQEIHALPVSDAELGRSLDAMTMLSRIEYAGLAVIGAVCLYHLGMATVSGAAYQELLGLH